MSEKLFRFNPYRIREWTEEQVSITLDKLNESLLDDDSPSALAHDIDVYANVGYLVGELISRYTELADNAEAKLKVKKADTIYRLRETWGKTEVEKAPAMDYFVSKANSMFLDDDIALNAIKSRLLGLKYAYTSIEAKQNALKRKFDAIKFDVLNQ